MRNGMLKIEIIDPIVLTSLKAKFPKANSAENALDKYVALLGDMLTESELRGVTSFNQKFNTYSISLSKLNKQSPTITAKKKKIRVHKWLVDNKLALVNVEIKGSSFGINQGLSIVSISKLITFTKRYLL
jgi:hypothetical protein